MTGLQPPFGLRSGRMRQVLFALVVACLLSPSWAALRVRADEVAARAEFLETSDGKPPLKFNSVRLTLVNPADKPMWYVLPYWGDRPLAKDGKFAMKAWEGVPFEGKLFEGEGGHAVQVLMYGREGFKAFRLPPLGHVVLDGYVIEAWKDIDAITLIEAQNLNVNGKTPLENWLPYTLTSGAKVKIFEKAIRFDWKNLDWDADANHRRQDYPTGKVEYVKAEGIRLLTVTLEGKPRANAAATKPSTEK